MTNKSELGGVLTLYIIGLVILLVLLYVILFNFLNLNKSLID